MSLPIYDNVPVPHRAERRAYPFEDLDVDQCFMVECSDLKQERSVRSSATRCNQMHPKRRYIDRRLPKADRDGGGATSEYTGGVWRIL